MVCAIQQPTFLPWLGYFEMISRVDLFVFLDNAQLTKRDWGVRNKIKNERGIHYLTVPIKKSKIINKLFATEALINYEQNFSSNHLKTIQFAYGKAPYFEEVYPFVVECFKSKIKVISEFNILVIKKISAKIGITTETIKSSQITSITGKKDDLLVSICKAVKADTYLSAEGSQDYIERNNPGGAFSSNAIKLYYRRYTHPSYPQLFGEFITHLCILDLLFNVGFKNSKKVIIKGSRPPVYYKDLY